MAFYDLPKDKRAALVATIYSHVLQDLSKGKSGMVVGYFGDDDTYIRKAAYLAIGKIYSTEKPLQQPIITLLDTLHIEENVKIRQTAINAAGEIGKKDFAAVKHFFDKGLFDAHHSPRNAVIGSIKKMGEINPKPVLTWAKTYLNHPKPEIRREICHGIELRGRTFPQDILPMLKQLEHDETSRVRKTLVHVLGQIAYKEGCLGTVISHLKTWKNKELVNDALGEIIDVHARYKNFSALTQKQAILYIKKNFTA